MMPFLSVIIYLGGKVLEREEQVLFSHIFGSLNLSSVAYLLWTSGRIIELAQSLFPHSQRKRNGNI